MRKIFSFTGAKKIIFGNGSLSTLAGHIKELHAQNPLVVIDKNLAKTGLPEKSPTFLFPKALNLQSMIRLSRSRELNWRMKARPPQLKIKAISSSASAAAAPWMWPKPSPFWRPTKAARLIIWGSIKFPNQGLPKIMIPTTAGTGSEVTFTAVFVRKNLKKKEGMNSPYLYPELALLDPELTLSLPPAPTAQTGLDALCHAIESYTSVNASPMSEIFSLEAIMLIAENLRTCVHDGKNLAAREKMLLGSLICGDRSGQCRRNGGAFAFLSAGRQIRRRAWAGQYDDAAGGHGL